MGAIIELLLLSVLCASVGTVQGACRHVQNDDMVEYSCVGGQLSDLDSLPASTGKIRISHMPVTVITRDLLARFGSDLWVFGCSFCGIRDIEPGAFQHLENLQQLSLENNQLTTIRESSIGGLEYLTYLDLNYNAISTIEDGVFQTLPGLIDLRLSGNNLECLNLQALSKLKELKRVFLTENSEFKCPNAVSIYLENRGVSFAKDPEWDRITEDLVEVEFPDDYDTDYYYSTTMQNTPLPPYRERLHPGSASSPLEQPSTPSYVPQRFQTTEEVVYPHVYYTPDSGTSQTRTSPKPDAYDEKQEETRPYLPPRTIAPLEPVTDPPNQQSGDEETTWRSWSRPTEPAVTRPELPLYTPHGNEDSHYGQQTTYSSEVNSRPLAPDQQQTTPFVESNAGPANATTPMDWWRWIPPVQWKDVPSNTSDVDPPASPDNVNEQNVHAPPTVGYPMAAQPVQTTTDKPLPLCVNKSSTSSVQRPLGLVILAVVTVLAGHGFVEGF